jgi:hypothetical protein
MVSVTCVEQREFVRADLLAIVENIAFASIVRSAWMRPYAAVRTIRSLHIEWQQLYPGATGGLQVYNPQSIRHRAIVELGLSPPMPLTVSHPIALKLAQCSPCRRTILSMAISLGRFAV